MVKEKDKKKKESESSPTDIPTDSKAFKDLEVSGTLTNPDTALPKADPLVIKAAANAFSGIDLSGIKLAADAFSGIDLSGIKLAADAFSGIDLSGIKLAADALRLNVAIPMAKMSADISSQLDKLRLENLEKTIAITRELIPKLAEEERAAKIGLRKIDVLQRDYDTILNSPVFRSPPLSNNSEIKRLREENKQLRMELEKAKATKKLEDDRDYR